MGIIGSLDERVCRINGEERKWSRAQPYGDNRAWRPLPLARSPAQLFVIHICESAHARVTAHSSSTPTSSISSNSRHAPSGSDLCGTSVRLAKSLLRLPSHHLTAPISSLHGLLPVTRISHYPATHFEARKTQTGHGRTPQRYYQHLR